MHCRRHTASSAQANSPHSTVTLTTQLTVSLVLFPYSVSLSASRCGLPFIGGGGGGFRALGSILSWCPSWYGHSCSSRAALLRSSTTINSAMPTKPTLETATCKLLRQTSVSIVASVLTTGRHCGIITCLQHIQVHRCITRTMCIMCTRTMCSTTLNALILPRHKRMLASNIIVNGTNSFYCCHSFLACVRVTQQHIFTQHRVQPTHKAVQCFCILQISYTVSTSAESSDITTHIFKLGLTATGQLVTCTPFIVRWTEILTQGWFEVMFP